MNEDILHNRNLWVAAAVVFVGATVAGYFLWNFFETRAAVVAGGFSSAREMNLLHRLGYGSRAAYLADLNEQKEQELQAQRIQDQLSEDERIAERERVELEADFDRRVQALASEIVLVSPKTEGSSAAKLAESKFACELATDIERRAVLLGARVGLFKVSKVNSLVQEEPASIATVSISVPVRWNEEKGVCIGWFTVDGIYNGSRYRGFYYGVVHSLRKDEEGHIRVLSFDKETHFVKMLEREGYAQ